MPSSIRPRTSPMFACPPDPPEPETTTAADCTCTTPPAVPSSVESLTVALAARCGKTTVWLAATPFQNVRSACQFSLEANADSSIRLASLAQPTAEQSNSISTVNGVATRGVTTTLFVRYGGGGGAPPEPVIAMHSS